MERVERLKTPPMRPLRMSYGCLTVVLRWSYGGLMILY
nr:MAG TPA: hypothetical protein [Caudoviricetes sp.]